MQDRTVEQVESWESRPFSGGFGSLDTLAENDFSGTVVAGGTWLFMLNGRVVGVFEGSIEDFGESSGTIYDAPHRSLPLLFSMQEQGGETRAKYFTNDTPIEKADKMLSESNFTGYVELSENVLSGDYYIAYYGGKKMSAAFIGQSERLLTGQEAYERTADEVGVYEVLTVSLDIQEIPTPEPSDPDTTTEETSSVGAIDSTSETDSEESMADPAESVTARRATEGETGTDDTEDVSRVTFSGDPVESADAAPSETTEDPETREGPADDDPEPTESDREVQDSSEGGPPDSETPTADSTGSESYGPDQTDFEPTDTARRDTEATDEPTQGPDTEPDAERRSWASEPADVTSDADPDSMEPIDRAPEGKADDVEKAEHRPVFEEEEQWRKTRSIPSLDPDETDDGEAVPSVPPERSEKTARPSSSSGPSQPTEDVRSHIGDLQAAISERETKIQELTSALSETKSERDDLAEKLQSLREERNELSERVSNLESALQRTKSEQSASSMATELSPREALEGTNLFVRYESKGKSTLDSLTSGAVDPDAANENLRLEHHTQFEAEDVAVEGQPFAEFLEQSAPYRFVTWLVRSLPYELLESGKTASLETLYDVIPDIDRAEFYGTVEVTTNAGQEKTEDFSVVIRDRMGNPLIVAELNPGRDPVQGEEMTELIDAADTVVTAEESLAGAIYVTASFFEPDALEVAKGEAAEGGLFSRSNRASFVKVARKTGYHLLLVEDRGEAYHVTVPDL